MAKDIKRPVGRPKDSFAPKTKLKPEALKKTVRRQFRFTKSEFSVNQEAAEKCGVTVSAFLRSAAQEKADRVNDASYRRRLQFLSEISEKNENEVIKTAVYELYTTKLTQYIYEQASVIRETPPNEHKPLIEDLIKVLYKDLGNEKAVKEYLVHLEIPSLYGKSWRLPDVRKLIHDLNLMI